MNDPAKNGAWFKPKRFGYGAGLPIAWQGWVMVIAHVVLILGGFWLLRRDPITAMSWVAIIGVIPVPVYAHKTKGDWKWRWPSKD